MQLKDCWSDKRSELERFVVYSQKRVVSNSCDPMDCSPPGSSHHGTSQARILEWDPPDPGINPVSPALAGEFFFFTTEPLWKPLCGLGCWKWGWSQSLGFFWLLLINRNKELSKISPSGVNAVLARLWVFVDREEWLSGANMNLFSKKFFNE